MFRRSRAVRRLIITVVSALSVAALAIGGGVTLVYQRADVSTVGSVDFTDELPIPPLADSRIAADGARVFDLQMQAGRTEFRPGRFTETWGFNGDYLGPTLRAARGETVRVRVRNALPDASTVHWHGMHLPAAMDGGPHQMVASGAEWTPQWTIDQPAATLWYHPHPHGETESHVRRGLAGMFILDDPAATATLPRTYGVDDLPIIVQDVKFRGDEFDGSHAMFRDVGFLGDQTMVNGSLTPYRVVGDELVRLRLLNASTARTYTFGFSDDRPFALIGTDGGLLERPAELNRIRLSPGERAEIVVRFEPGASTVLRSYPLDAGLSFWTQRFSGGDDTFDLMEFRAAATLRPSPPLPATLMPPGRIDVAGATERAFELSFGSINGQAMAMDHVDFAVTRGSTEIWTIRNIDGMPHNFHVHDVQFRVLERDGAPPPVDLSGPKDTVFLPPGGSVRLALRFDGPADPETPYMYHCHLLWHEDTGMMGQFVVVEPGGVAGTPPVHGH
ncbi:multicopper oxidase family protein [Nocardia cyriacigeorgica]|uniref:multicopper oxidase family protein n=1 Tax=Nocardia cyriacigeorgica TaxID=135487 RepID=UPI00189467DD|nr:multicopper oxidase domain-containing protein [Nocardia cyriacigeorgica]MBF6455125.1 multicopper oxidase domain-containing protein [Nocardia cyriacigeorgica]MBF6476982.1 multicopper oxidase domain-containing protein [Nocardia cyriacigeorgica]MBF6554133.1 multicopper oxidase domain-containing protein [Nocardia cyriacigeorgica]